MAPAERLRGSMAGMLAGVLAGFLGGLFGVGGGVILVPVLTARFRLTQHQAHGTLLAVIGATAIASLFVYGAAAHVMWRVALVTGIASAIGAPLGARFITRVPARALRLAFAGFLVLVAARMFWLPAAPPALAAHAGGAAWAIELAIGVTVGWLAGVLGVGGGAMAVQAFSLLLGMPQAVAQGTSLAVILVTAPAGAIEHHRHGQVRWSLVPLLALGAALGAAPAAALANRLPHALLARGFAVFLLISAALIGWRSRRAGAPPTGALAER